MKVEANLFRDFPFGGCALEEMTSVQAFKNLGHSPEFQIYVYIVY